MTHWHAYTDAPEPVWFTGGQADVYATLIRRVLGIDEHGGFALVIDENNVEGLAQKIDLFKRGWKSR